MEESKKLESKLLDSGNYERVMCDLTFGQEKPICVGFKIGSVVYEYNSIDGLIRK